jgi:two-component system, NarL family, nitrate/nitrite response regulator NarL
MVVVTFSTRDDPALIREAIRAGAHSYVRKSVDPGEARTAIEAAATGSCYTSRAHAAAMESDLEPERPELSGQEREVLRLYATGLTMTSVARRLKIKSGTAKSYLDRVRDKYDQVGRSARTKIELRDRAVEDGILPSAPADV